MGKQEVSSPAGGICLSWARESLGPVQPLPCSSRRHDSPVLSSSKPKFIKVPTVFSSHISDHFLSSSAQDLVQGTRGHGQGRAETPLPLSPATPRELTRLRLGRASSGNGSAPRRGPGPPAAAPPRPPLGPQPVPSRRQTPRSVGPRTSACPWRSSWRREPQITDPGHLPGGVHSAPGHRGCEQVGGAPP